MPVPKYFFKDDCAIMDFFEGELSIRIHNFEDSAKTSDALYPDSPDFRKRMAAAFTSSGFIARTLARHPSIISDLVESRDLDQSYETDRLFETVKKIRLCSKNQDDLGSNLRKLRAREYVRIAWRDINGLADLDETLRDLSLLAEACVDQVCEFIFGELALRYGYPKRSDGRIQKLLVLGMGKLGARELNFSSDIDLIFAYPENTWVNEDITSDEFFTKLARSFLKVFAENSPEGLLFRVDMRLRPYGDAGPIVMSFSSMEDYYQTQGREWERYALIKARVVAGQPDDGEELTDMLRPFVYRRYFDYSTFEAIRDLKKSIASEVQRKQLSRNIKLGAGGIREIEFFGQVFQLLRGGVESELQERSILKILKILSLRNYIPDSVRQELESAYYFFRNLEHRIQQVEDRQTHDLPENELEKLRICIGMGFSDYGDFSEVLEIHQAKVHNHFRCLLGGENGEESDICAKTEIFEGIWQHPENRDATMEILGNTGFKDPENSFSNIIYIRELSLKQAGEKGKLKLDRLMPTLLKKISESDFPDTALSRIADLLKAIMQRTCYIALLQENLVSVDNLIKLASASPWIVNFLSRHPVLLDELLDPRTLYSPPSKEELREDLGYRLGQIDDENMELQMETLCVFKQSRILRVAAADITASYPLMRVSDHLTEIAETLLETVLELSFRQIAKRLAAPESLAIVEPAINSFAIIGYGKLGGLELGYGSDLDIVFLHQGEGEYSKGFDGIDTSYFFTRVAQIMIHFLTTHSNAGTLYEVDTRLRPSGSAGVLVSHINGFEDYLLNQAWTWEHQAIVRARVIVGGKDISERFNDIRKRILCIKRDVPSLKKEITEMSEKIRTHNRKKPVSGFHLKYDKGGIVDIEFFVQYLVLAYSNAYPEMSIWTDNVRILETAAKTGIISEETSLCLKKAYLSYRIEVHKRDLLGLDHEVEEDIFSEHRAFVIKTWNEYL